MLSRARAEAFPLIYALLPNKVQTTIELFQMLSFSFSLTHYTLDCFTKDKKLPSRLYMYNYVM